jgi:two-component system phosphate regulon response regulator PhoB
MILDVMMGELSGFNLAEILRKRPETKSIPIIFCSALDGESDKIKGLDIGADDYISKPFSVAEVMARVRSVLRRSSHRTEIHEEIVDDNIISFIFGLFIGGNVSFFAIALLMASKKGDRDD